MGFNKLIFELIMKQCSLIILKTNSLKLYHLKVYLYEKMKTLTLKKDYMCVCVRARIRVCV